jgi:peptide/nickel transport system substrate-binding protein
LVGCNLGEGGSEHPAEAVVAYSAQPDSLDPATSASVETLSLLWTVYTPPLTYRHVDGRPGAELVPGLAESMPTVSRDGRTYRFRFRAGLRYSDGSPLHASDFERAVKRVLSAASAGSRFFMPIAGVPRYLKRRDEGGDISGIEADDRRREVTIRLRAPDGTFVYALATTYAAPVSRSAPFDADSGSPPPGIGPFRVEEVERNRQVSLARTSVSLPEVPKPRLERIRVRVIANTRRQTEEVRRGRLDYMFDPVPADMRPEVKREHSDRYEEFVSNSTYYFWLNSAFPPFDNPALRKAVHLALNKPALARLYGGSLEPTCNFLPPGMPGHRRLEPCPFGDPHSAGDVRRAREIVDREGAIGTDVTVWGNSLSPTQEVTEAFAEQLRAIGFKPRLEIVSPTVYFQVVGRRDSDLHAGFGNWFQEYPHPASFLAAVRGDLITETGNYNYSRTDVPSLTRAIKRLQRRPELTPGLERKWAALERRLIKDAGVIPFGHRRLSTFMSSRMDFEHCSPNHAVYLTDFTRFCVRDG